jgi:hypothetical protein
MHKRFLARKLFWRKHRFLVRFVGVGNYVVESCMTHSGQLLTLAAAGITVWLCSSAPAAGQAPKGPGPQQKSVPTVSMAFRNDLDKPVIIQGHSIVGGIQRRGQPIAVPAGKVNFDNNVPAGPPGVRLVRYVSVFDGAQPSRVLARNVQIPVETGRDVRVLIRVSPTNPDVILVVPDNGK